MGELFSSAQLHPGVGHDSKGLMENPWQARGHCSGWCLGPTDVCTGVRVGCIKELYSQTLLLSPSCQSPSAAVHVPGGSGGALTPALCGWRGHQSGQDLQREEEVKGGQLKAGSIGSRVAWLCSDLLVRSWALPGMAGSGRMPGSLARGQGCSILSASVSKS